MKTIFVVIIIFCLVGCSSSKGTTEKGEKSSSFTPTYIPGPHALVYKTKKDYYNLVPVILSEDKSQIISYPHKSDLIVGSEYSLPTILHRGYLLDNRGISKNVAFLKLTYEEYFNFEEIPTIQELFEYIIDSDPLIELCDCGNRTTFKNMVVQLNELIDEDLLEDKCKKMK